MGITQELAERIARLARLSLTREEKTDLSARLEDVLGTVTDPERLRLEEEAAEEPERVDALRPNETEQGGAEG